MDIFFLTLRFILVMILDSVQSMVPSSPQSASLYRSTSLPARLSSEQLNYGGPIMKLQHTAVVCRGEHYFGRYDAFRHELLKLNPITGKPEKLGNHFVTIPLTELLPGDLLVTPKGYIDAVYEGHGVLAGFRQLPEDKVEHWRQYKARRNLNHA